MPNVLGISSWRLLASLDWVLCKVKLVYQFTITEGSLY